jgi:hypothetical protein
MPSGNDLTFDVTKIARDWYTRRAQDWRKHFGFILQMGDESQADEIASAASPARAPSPSRTTPSPA